MAILLLFNTSLEALDLALDRFDQRKKEATTKMIIDETLM